MLRPLLQPLLRPLLRRIDDPVPNALVPSLDLRFTIGGTLDPRVAFTRASGATRVNAQGLIEAVASNAPRFDYDPVTLAPKGLLIEEQRTNLLTYSEQFDNAVWTKSNVTPTSNSTLAPDGTNTADTLVEAAVASSFITGRSVGVSPGELVVFSVFAKAKERSVFNLLVTDGVTGFARKFDVLNGTSAIEDVASTDAATLFGVTNEGNGWYRCWVAARMVGSSTNLQIRLNNNGDGYTGDGVSGIYIWGAQLEAGSFPTSYIPTTSAAATRAADVAVMTGANFSSWYRQDEGALFAEGDSSGGTTPCFVSVDDATTANRIQLRRGSLTNTTASFRMVSSGGSIDVTLVSSPASIFKQAAAVKASDQMSAANGSLFTLTPVPTMPVVTQATIGNGIGSTYLNGHIRRIAYFPRRLANSELLAITS